MDSGNDSQDNIKLFIQGGADFTIKRNLRKESPIEWLLDAKMHGVQTKPWAGKIVYTGRLFRDRGFENLLRIVFQVTKRSTLTNGQMLIVSEIEVQAW